MHQQVRIPPDRAAASSQQLAAVSSSSPQQSAAVSSKQQQAAAGSRSADRQLGVCAHAAFSLALALPLAASLQQQLSHWRVQHRQPAARTDCALCMESWQAELWSHQPDSTCCSTAAEQHSSTAAQQHSSTAAQRHSSTACSTRGSEDRDVRRVLRAATCGNTFPCATASHSVRGIPAPRTSWCTGCSTWTARRGPSGLPRSSALPCAFVLVVHSLGILEVHN